MDLLLKIYMNKFVTVFFALILMGGVMNATDQRAVKVGELAEMTQSWGDTTLPSYPAGKPDITNLRITIKK